MGPLRIIRGLGGNGSTFITRVLATIEKVVLLSETNPLSANLFSFSLNPVTQIGNNYQHLDFAKYSGNISELGAPNLFGAYIAGLMAECHSFGKILTIRDYNYVDYIGTPFIWPVPRRSSLDAALTNIPTLEILLIRHPIPQFMSLLSHPELSNVLDYREFLEGYRTMLDQHRAARVIRFEDVFSAFDRWMPEIAAHFSLPLPLEWKTRIRSVSWVTGHDLGRSSVQPEPKQQPIDSEMRDLFRPFEDYRAICEKCGYEA
jgi:hypothetical protein